MKNILILTSQVRDAIIIKDTLKDNHHTEIAYGKEEFFKMFARKKHDYLFIDLENIQSGSNTDFKNELKPFWQIFPDSEIIILTAQNTIRRAVEAVKAGASDYLSLPLNSDDIYYVIRRIEERIKLLSELNYLRNVHQGQDFSYMLKTNSAAMHELLANLRSVAQTESTVLVTGETGTGKGVIARLIHQYSKRSDKQFISVHCGAIPETLLESELFGHEKGAFTGAVRRKLGKFEIAHGGTIFLDEIGTISAPMQIKLLQVLQEKTFYRVGGESEIKSDVRIIAATNADLKALADHGSFRMDLYYRLNVFQLELPSLRDRLVDLPLLCDQFLKKLNRANAKNISGIQPEVMQAFNEYEWPGNIRELENLLERAFILENSAVLTTKSFPIRLFKEKLKKYMQPVDTSNTLQVVRQNEIDRVEKEYLEEILFRYKGRITESAQAAGIGVRQLNKLMQKYNLKKEKFKN
ncbi:MAG: sigma-54-dependent Fis family transcriptional regulator [Calditrichaeota bacterium]|nr:sigma-54-dependent Fis family transcriptional regulator [Calditrichota bacterium]